MGLHLFQFSLSYAYIIGRPAIRLTELPPIGPTNNRGPDFLMQKIDPPPKKKQEACSSSANRAMPL